MTSATAIAITLACAWSLPGCGDQCKDGESECQGAQIRTCDTSDDIYADWRGLGPNCGSGTCIDLTDLTEDGLREAVCSTTGELDPDCTGAPPAFCNAAGQDVRCGGGYSTLDDCTAVGQYCVDAGSSGVFCALGSATDPACVEDGANCDGTSVINCYAGYVDARAACDAGFACEPTSVTWDVSGYVLVSDLAYCTSAIACAGSDQATCDADGNITGCIGGETVAMSCGSSGDCDETDTPWGTTEAQCVTR